MPTFVGMTNQEMACRDASFRRKPESSAGERQSTGCAEQLHFSDDFSKIAGDGYVERERSATSCGHALPASIAAASVDAERPTHVPTRSVGTIWDL